MDVFHLDNVNLKSSTIIRYHPLPSLIIHYHPGYACWMIIIQLQIQAHPSSRWSTDMTLGEGTHKNGLTK